MSDPLAQLRNEFLTRCASDLSELRSMAPEHPELRRIAHRLAGAAGSFGYPELGAVAAHVEAKARDGSLTAAELRRLLDMLAMLAR